MLRKHMAACLMITALTAAPAMAQGPSGGTDRPIASGSGSNAAGSPAMQPGNPMGAGSTGGVAAPSNSTMGANPNAGGAPPTASAAPTPNPGASTETSATSGRAATTQGTMPPAGGEAQKVGSAPPPAGGGNFISQQQTGQMMASKLIGTGVVSQNNESIGDVNDVLIDNQGKVQGVLIGVGGFLGIGEKSVAVPFDRIEFTSRNRGQSADTSTSGSGAVNLSSSNTSGSASNTGASGNAQNPSTTGSTGSASQGASGSSANPDRITLKMTKDELQQAPAFQTADKAKGNESTQGAGSTSRAPNPNPSTGNK